MKIADNFKKNIIADILAAVTIILMIFSLSFYKSATLSNYSVVTVVIGVVAMVIFLADMFFDLKGWGATIACALVAFCFGYFLISRLESLNFIQVGLSDINRYFYIDIVFFSLSLVAALATAIVKKIRL